MLVDLDQEQKRIRFARRARLNGSILALLALGALAATVVSLVEFSRERKFAKEAVPAEATILKHYMVPQIGQVDVEFTDPIGHTHRRTIMMELKPWQNLANAKTVPIEYVRSNPSLFRLVRGEHHLDFSKFWICGLIVSLFLAAATIFTFLGYDLKTISGILQVTRLGMAPADGAVVRVYRIGKLLRWGSYFFWGSFLFIQAPFCLYRAMIHFPIPADFPEMTYQWGSRRFWMVAALASVVLGTYGILKTRASGWGKLVEH